MVDAQHAGVAHVGGVERAQGRPALHARRRADWARAGSSSAPRRERIGRRADDTRLARARRRAPRPPPRRAPRRPRDRGRSRSRGRARALAPRRAQADGRRATGRRAAKSKALRSLGDRALDRLRVAVAQRAGPESPVRAGLAGCDRLEGGEPPQRIAAGLDERAVLCEEPDLRPREAGAVEGRMERRERRALDRPDRRIVDEPRRRRPRRWPARGRRAPPRASRRAAGSHRERRSESDRESAGRTDDRGSPVRGRAGNSICIGLTPR